MKDFAVDIAKKAGEYLLANFKNDETLLKERGSSKEVVTKYDVESDRIIVEAIKKEFPGHNIMAEESGSVDKGSDYTWIVDSLDGTGNYAMSNPFWNVTLALAKNDEIIIGVINAPALGEFYLAEKGKGATMNGKSLKVSEVAKLSGAYAVSCEGNNSTHERAAAAFNTLWPKLKDLRKLGAGALECAAVATARVEAFFSFDVDPWDVAAGVLLVQEAGGKATDFDGKPWTPKKTDFVVSNGKVHEELRQLLK